MIHTGVTMPRCCGACDHWTFVGRAKQRPLSERTSRHGKCALKKVKTWMVQSCNGFSTHESIDIETIEQPSQLVLEPIQESLL